jgi:DUF971 family protein
MEPSPAEPTDRTTPADIDIVRDREVTVTFGDGVVCRFEVPLLRANCPCASCRGRRERGEPAWPRPGQAGTVSIAHAELTGAWGLSIEWSDGHSTGIYAWSVLRQWWDGGLLPPMVSDHRGGTDHQ